VFDGYGGSSAIGRTVHNRISAIQWKRGWMGKERRDLSDEGDCHVVWRLLSHLRCWERCRDHHCDKGRR
jgi:hypothetical protein